MAANSEELDQLLDSALDDFQALSLSTSSQRGLDSGKKKEETLLSNSSVVQGLGMGLPDLRSRKKGKQKVAKESHVTEALDKLKEQTREAVKGLESITGKRPVTEGFGNDPMIDDWVKQFEEMAGGQDMESIMETMMQQLLSRDILYEPMKEIAERYPKWLEDNKFKLSSEDYRGYSHQHELIKELIGVHETEPENFTKVVELMQKMQECGQPPSDIVQALAPEFDLASIGQLSPEMLAGQQGCCIM